MCLVWYPVINCAAAATNLFDEMILKSRTGDAAPIYRDACAMRLLATQRPFFFKDRDQDTLLAVHSTGAAGLRANNADL